MKRSNACLFAFAVVVMISAVPVFAEQPCKPVVGHFEATLAPAGVGFCPAGSFCTSGRVWGGISGTYEFIMAASVPSGAVPTIFFFTGRSTVTLKSGDQVLGTDTGSIDFALGGFASLITFDAGGGQIRLRGDFSALEGTTSGDYIGTLCR